MGTTAFLLTPPPPSPVFSEKDVLYKLYSYIAQWVAMREPLQIMHRNKKMSSPCLLSNLHVL